MTKVSVITCTGNRSEALQLCAQYMKAQDYKGEIEWIVVNDGVPVSGDLEDVPFCKIVKGPIPWERGINTHRYNELEALKHITGDYILHAEDDDCYFPSYISTMVKMLEHCEVAGEGNAKYYNVTLPGYKEMRNYQHAALAQTALRRSALPMLKAAVDSGELYFDIHMWRNVQEKKVPSLILANTNLVIGMKGLPGREGIGEGHKLRDYLIDADLVKLREWCGVYAENYSPFIKESRWKKKDQ